MRVVHRILASRCRAESSSRYRAIARIPVAHCTGYRDEYRERFNELGQALPRHFQNGLGIVDGNVRYAISVVAQPNGESSVNEAAFRA